jgi:membrane-associated protease RseP (regulator of RpoE activity)
MNAIKKSEQQKEPQSDNPDSRKIGPTLKQFGNRFNIIISGASPGTKSFSMSQDATGKIVVTITESDKNGKQTTKTYEASNSEEFKQKYPEIAKEYGIGEKQPTTIEIPDFDFDDIFKDFGRSWGKRFDDEINRLRDMFNRRSSQAPNAQEPEDETPLLPRSAAFPETDLGFSMGDADNKLLVNNVEPNGLGAQIGLKKGDTIVSVNGVSADNLWQCRRQIKAGLAKGRVNLIIIRENKKETLIYPK